MASQGGTTHIAASPDPDLLPWARSRPVDPPGVEGDKSPLSPPDLGERVRCVAPTIANDPHAWPVGGGGPRGASLP